MAMGLLFAGIIALVWLLGRERDKPIKWKGHIPKLLEPGNQLLQGFDRFKATLLTVRGDAESS